MPKEFEIRQDLGVKPCVRWKTSDPEAVSCFKLSTAAGLIDDSILDV